MINAATVTGWILGKGCINTRVAETARTNVTSNSESPRLFFEGVANSQNAATTKITSKTRLVVEGANLEVNEYGNTIFADFFFFITGFHGFHVFSGIIFNIIVFFNVIVGTYEKRGHYEMVEKVGLYWHFVDLVWVFVFTFFYLV